VALIYEISKVVLGPPSAVLLRRTGALVCAVQRRLGPGATPAQARRGSHVVRLNFCG
jgi:hypothetical protein